MVESKQGFKAQEIEDVAKALGVDWSAYDKKEFTAGMQVELEHGRIDPQTNITNDDTMETAQIVLAHLKEVKDYYTKLGKMVESDKGIEEAPKEEEIKNLHKESKSHANENNEISPSVANKITDTLSVESKEGGEIEMTKKEEKKVEKVEEVKPEVVVEKPATEVKTEVVVEKPATEVKPEVTEVKPETKVEEVVVEKAEPAPKEEDKEEEDEDKEDANPEHGKPGHKCDSKCKEYKEKAVVAEYNPEKVDALNEKVIALTAKIDLLVTLMKQAPAEGASAKEVAPKEVVKVETPKEEVKKSDTSPEGTDELILKAVGELKTSFEDRIKKLESQPAASKVVVYAREFAGQPADAGDITLEKINGELKELETLKSADPTRYMNDGSVDRAFELVKMRKQFNAKK